MNEMSTAIEKETKVRLFSTLRNTTVNGSGARYAIFMQGCAHNCKGCHSKDSHSLEAGIVTTYRNLLDDINANLPLLDGVTFSGGDPLYNWKATLDLCKAIKELPNWNENQHTVWLYTGYTYEEVLADENLTEVIKAVDVIVDGKFDIDKKSNLLRFRGSSNQRIFELKKDSAEPKQELTNTIGWVSAD